MGDLERKPDEIEPVVPIEIQQVENAGAPVQHADDPAAVNPDIEARIQELRDRGRVGVLSEGTERPDTSHRIKNSDYDSEAVASVNKANELRRLSQKRHDEGIGREPRIRVGRNFENATMQKLDKVVRKDSEGGGRLRQYFEDPEGWEEELREWLRESSYGYSDEEIERHIDTLKSINERELRQIGEDTDRARQENLRWEYKDLRARTIGQDEYRGDLLDLYARDPEKYKAMSTEEFVEEGLEFRRSSLETARIAALESWGKPVKEQLDQLVEETSAITDFCRIMNRIVSNLYGRVLALDEDYDNYKELISFVETIEGKVTAERETPDEDSRSDTQHRLEYANTHGYFTSADFAKDLDRTPREQMREAVERAEAVIDKWIQAGKAAREEFDQRWGKAPSEEEPAPQTD